MSRRYYWIRSPSDFTPNPTGSTNHLGKVLDRLTKTGEPILVSKGREIRAVLVTPEQFQRRFLDWQAEHERELFLDRLETLRASKKGTVGSLSTLRQLRGYGS